MIVTIGTLSVPDSQIVLDSVSTFVVNRHAIVNWYVSMIDGDRMLAPMRKQTLMDGARKTIKKHGARDPIQNLGLPYLAVSKKLKKEKHLIVRN